MSRRNRHAWVHRVCSRVVGRHDQIAYIDQLNVENQIGLGWNPGVGRVGPGAAARAICQLPRDEETALAAHLHSFEALIKAGNDSAKSLRKADWLGIAELWLAVFVEHRFAILVLQGLTMILR